MQFVLAKSDKNWKPIYVMWPFCHILKKMLEITGEMTYAKEGKI